MSTLVDNINFLMKHNNTTLTRLVEVSNTNWAWGSSLINGKLKSYDVYKMASIAKYFEVSLEDLLFKRAGLKEIKTLQVTFEPPSTTDIASHIQKKIVKDKEAINN
jgi:hypothetical protein